MSDKPKKEEQPIIVKTGENAPPPDPLEGAHKDSKGVWVNKDGQPLSAADAELARQRLTAKGEPRKQ